MRDTMNGTGNMEYISAETVPPDTPESIGAMAALAVKANAQGATRFFADPIDIRRALIAKANLAGWNTPIGHGCSNVIEILDNLYGYERPAWATHEMQTLPWSLNWQMKRLEQLAAV